MRDGRGEGRKRALKRLALRPGFQERYKMGQGLSRAQQAFAENAGQVRQQVNVGFGRYPVGPFDPGDIVYDPSTQTVLFGNRVVDRWGRDVAGNLAATRFAPGIHARRPGNAVGHPKPTLSELLQQRHRVVL